MKLTLVPRRFGAAPISASGAVGNAAREALPVQRLLARDLDQKFGGQRVHHRRADAVQAARGGIGLAGEFAAGMQRCQDHLDRRLAGEFRMLADRHAAAIVADRQPVARFQMHLDPVGMAGHRLIHRIVEDLGREMVQRPLVGAADIHAGAVAHRLQPFKDLDVRCVIPVG